MSDRYKEFAERIDVETFMDAVELFPDGYTVKENKHGEPEAVGQCPDTWGLHKHGDSTGKFALNLDKRVYNCFVCGGGSLLSLVMALYDMDVESATDFLRPMADDSSKTDDQWLSDIDRLLGKLHEDRAPADALPYFNTNVLRKWDVYEDNLRRWNAGEFDNRPKNIAIDVLHECGVRFASDATKYPPRDPKGQPIGETYFGPAVIFPHYVGERLVGWQNRWLSDLRPKWVAKYTNTPDFPKSTTLFRPFGGFETHLPVVVVESVPTALFVVGCGWPAVATFGAKPTPDQLKLLRRFQQGVIIAPDNDKPGVQALVTMADYLEGFIPVSYVEPEGQVGFDLMDRQHEEDVLRLLHSAIRVS